MKKKEHNNNKRPLTFFILQLQPIIWTDSEDLQK